MADPSARPTSECTRSQLGPKGGGGSTIPTAPPLNARRGVPVYREPASTTLSRPLAAGVLQYDAYSAIRRRRRRSPLYVANLSANCMGKRHLDNFAETGWWLGPTSPRTICGGSWFCPVCRTEPGWLSHPLYWARVVLWARL